MLEKKIFFGGMDSDSDDRVLENGDYRDMLNAQNSVPDKSNVGAIPNTKGNVLVSHTLPGGINTVIGTYDDVLNGHVYYFIHNENGDHRISRYDSRAGTVTELVTNSALNFNTSYPVLHVDLVEDLLYWTDNYNEPSMIRVSIALTGHYNVISSRQYFDAIAYAPHYPPQDIEYVSDSSFNSNNVRGKQFQFRYTWVYDDNRESASSPISKVAIPVTEPIYMPAGNYETYINNKIEFTVNSGFEYVKSIKVYVREGNTGDWYLAKTLDKSELSIQDEDDYTFGFYNNEAWTPVDQSYINRLFDLVPLKAQCQSLIAGKRLTYTNILEGYDNITPDVSVEAVYNTVDDVDTTLQGAYSDPGSGWNLTQSPTTTATSNNSQVPLRHIGAYIVASGVTEDQVFTLDYSFSIGVSTGPEYTEKQVKLTNAFAAGATSQDIAQYFANAINNSSVLSGTKTWTVGATTLSYTYTTTAVATAVYSGYVVDIFTSCSASYVKFTTLSFSVSNTVIKRTLKTNSVHKFGLVYYDDPNRSGLTQAVSAMDLNVTPYSSHPNDLGHVSMKMTINHQPPSWAKYYQVVYTGNKSKLNWLQVKCGTVVSVGQTYKIYLTTISTYNAAYPDSNLVYGFSKGDRITVLRDSSGVALTQFSDAEIVSSDTDGTGQYIVVRNTISVAPQTGGYIEIYTPATTISESVYYEIGEVYPIQSGYHVGTSQDQTASQPAILEMECGDSYFRFRGGVMGFNVEDPSLSDFYTSNSWDKGRPNRVEKEYKQIRRPDTTYWTEAYIPETNLNGLSTIYETSYEAGDIKFGSIMRTYAEDDKIEFYYQLKTSFRLVSKSVLYDAGGNETAVQQSSNVLSPESFYSGEFGIGDNPESWAVYKNARYHIDANRGVVLRLANDGYTPISDYKMSKYFYQKFQDLVNFGTPFRVWGVYDVRHQQYILCFTETNKTVVIAQDVVNDVATDITLPEEGSTSVISQGSASRTDSEVIVSAETGSSRASLAGTATYTIPATTIAFSEPKNRWVSRFSYEPECIGSCNIGMVSYKEGAIYVHDIGTTQNNFYSTQYTTKITFISNSNPSAVKFFQNIIVEGDTAWSMPSATTPGGQETSLITDDFELVEGVYKAAFMMDANTPVDNPLFEGDVMRDKTMEITLENDSTEETSLFSVAVRHAPSMMTDV